MIEMDARHASKAQSAMEYLSTYGWAILILVTVLFLLFQSGIINQYVLSPKAPPGACSVFRPAGPGTTTLIELSGICTGEIPQYAAVGGGIGANVVTAGSLPQLNQFTFTGWISNRHPRAGHSGDSVVSQSSCGMYLPGAAITYNVYFDTCGCKYVANNTVVGCATDGQVSNLNYNTWYMIAVTVNSTGYETTYAYTGATSVATTATYNGKAIYAPSSNAVFGAYGTSSSYPLNGTLANIQIYNISLTASELNALYIGGIGAPPLVLQNLVGWWPLNGNANDYSGDGYTATPTNITYTSVWTPGYTVP